MSTSNRESSSLRDSPNLKQNQLEIVQAAQLASDLTRKLIMQSLIYASARGAKVPK